VHALAAKLADSIAAYDQAAEKVIVAAMEPTADEVQAAERVLEEFNDDDGDNTGDVPDDVVNDEPKGEVNDD
jgi:hypothetical protein